MKRLHGMDVMLLYSETPNVHTHTLKIGVIDPTQFDGHLDFELFRRMLWQRLHSLDPLRYSLAQVPFKLHHPVWVEHSEVDLDYHLRQVRLPGPGGRRELDALAGEIASIPLDRSRPLWQMYLVEGMADGTIAVIIKVHHVLADGIATANLLARAMAFTGTAQDEREPSPPDPWPSRKQLLREAVQDHVVQLTQLPRLVAQTAEGVYRLRRRASARGAHPELAGRFSPAPSFINHTLSPGRQFASATLALADVKETAKRLGITINDLVLAMASGALRELLLRHDGRADRPLVASVPACLDSSPDRVSGNELGALNVSLPVNVDDPLERVRLTALGTSFAKEDFDLLGPRLIASWVSYLPPATAPAIFRWISRRRAQTRLLNVTVSNVPGPRARQHLGGAMVREFYSVGPLVAGSGMNITVWSYVDQLNISVLTDDLTLEDPHEATDAMVHAFTEIRCAAGLSGELTAVENAMAPAAAG